MSNVLILSENTVFKDDLVDQINHYITDFEVTEDFMLADIIVVDENLDLIKNIEKNKNAPIIYLGKEDCSDAKVQNSIQKPFGLSNFLDVLKSCNVRVYIVSIILIFILGVIIKFFPNKDFYNKRRIASICVIFLVLYAIAQNSLGEANFELTWDNWRTPRNIYNNFKEVYSL